MAERNSDVLERAAIALRRSEAGDAREGLALLLMVISNAAWHEETNGIAVLPASLVQVAVDVAKAVTR